MSNDIININLIKKINNFLKLDNSLKYLDPNIFDKIDEYKELDGISFNDYFLEYIANLPKLDYESVINISREVYKLFGKEKEFDIILEKLISNYIIDNGSLNPKDDNCITKANENRILLSGTYYDVILLCHEIGHKLIFENSRNNTYVMDAFLFETPSMILEFAADDYLRDNYDVDINAKQLRKMHILNLKIDNNIEHDIFLIIINLIKTNKLNVINLYREFIKYPSIVEYLSSQNCSIMTCFDEAMSNYSYDIGYILGSYTNSCDNKSELLNTFLNYKCNGINTTFSISEEIIKKVLESEQFIK